ncbi:DNA mismatch repair protein [Quaeritorhiza haematococci]|nr:DNA mismatch repair protein [Quaeritorhiza haematococci]
MIENSLDAGSTQVSVLIKDGGLKLLQIQDNGHGIAKEDLAIVCERFTTSKLKIYEDLYSIATYGFRGEALASISHVAHVTITTKTAKSPCAWRACYSDGKLVPAKPGASADPKPCAGNTGTQITVEDLFYNVVTRKKALKNPTEEYNRILDVVQRYAIHNAGVSFTCKKQGSSTADVHTASTATTVDNIRQIYGASVAKELLEVQFDCLRWEYKMKGHISNANYNAKKMVFLLFINPLDVLLMTETDRSVECNSLKRALENLYTPFLPKGTHPFIYLSLEIKPQNVDVNVHPTKREVSFLNEEEIVDSVCEVMQERLGNANSSRVFYMQTILPGALPPADSDNEAVASVKKTGSSSKVPEHKLVRTDSLSRTLDAFITHIPPTSKPLAEKAEKTHKRVEEQVPTGEQQQECAKDDDDDRPINPIRKKPRLQEEDEGFSSDGGGDDEDEPDVETEESSLKPRRNEQRSARAPNQSRIQTQLRFDAFDWTKGKNKSKSKITTKPLFDEDDFVELMEEDDEIPPTKSTVRDKGKRRAMSPASPVETGRVNKSEGKTARSEDPIDVEAIDVDDIKPINRSYVEVKLTSILELRQDVVDNCHKGLLEIFKDHHFVGCADDFHALIQHQTKLYLVKFQDASYELFYQLALKAFSNFGFINLSAPAPIFDVVMIALDQEDLAHWGEDMMSKEEIATSIVELLVDRRNMLLEYFSMKITPSGELRTLPLMLKGYIPNIDKLPTFLLRLGSEVNWENEKECFETMSRELALFYATEPPVVDIDDLAIANYTKNLSEKTSSDDIAAGFNELAAEQDAPSSASSSVDAMLVTAPNGSPDEVPSSSSAKFEGMSKEQIEQELLEDSEETKRFRWTIEHIVFPALRSHFIPPREMAENGTVVQIANLPDLYRVFERC